MKTRQECQELAAQAIGDYLSACLPESAEETFNPLTLLLSMCGHACVPYVGREVAANLCLDVAGDILKATRTVEIIGTGPARPTIQ